MGGSAAPARKYETGDSNMDQQGKTADETGAIRPGVAGTPLIHYGATWNLSASVPGGEQDNVAVLVCHGMGQQVRYETISAIAQAIRTEAAAQGGSVSSVEVHLSAENEAFLARAELSWKDKDEQQHCVHVYEAYWAPLTEGKVTYWDTIKFLLLAAWNGLRYSKPLVRSTFLRWMFGAPKAMYIGRASWFGLVCVLLFLLAQAGIIGYVSLELAAQYKNVLSQPLPTAADAGLFHAWLKWLAPLLPGHETLLHEGHIDHAWWVALAHLVIWVFLIAEAFAARYFIVEFVGDVAAYISPYKDSKFDELRTKIQKVGMGVGKVIYGFGKPLATVPKYKKIIMVGHSLGSVLAYDTLNALINLDNVSDPGERRGVVERTHALITFGSPLDKTAFIFRMAADNEQDWIREQLAASVQPLIVSYPLYRHASFHWINIWSRMDIISGSLDYYDDPVVPAADPKHVQNMIDPQARRPLLAHVQYWDNDLLRKQLYRYVS
jgi:hypothetical protein